MRRASMVGCLFALALLLGQPTAAQAESVKLDVTASCVGSTLSGVATITGLPVGTVITMQAQAQTTGWADVGAPVSVAIVAGQTTYPVTFNIAGVRYSKSFRITVDAGSGNSATSNHLATTTCGPPAQVPESPAPLLIPATMVLTAGAVEIMRRRRAGAARA